ncbi:MAG TPA: GGDEF domain-containing protein [Solirubrobacteraceae bacterium]|nr:GGDEF domain-containing protein [Solirubrobacteraceae bacterium]
MEPAPVGHRTTWLCPDAAARERLLDMDERLKRPRALAFGVLGATVIASIPTIGWIPLVLLVVAILGFVLMDHVRRRVGRPEYALVASWAFAQVVIAGAVALTGGTESHAVSWLMVPIVTLPARFGSRGLAAGVAFTGLLLLVVGAAVEPRDDFPQLYAVTYPLAAIVAVSLLLTALMRSDVDHRTDAVIDGLTGLLNRRALGHRLEELEGQACITGDPVAVIAGDIDHFKQVNDVHGHARGDAVLVGIAYRLRKELRAFDLAYRLGGEEFLVVLPGAREDEAVAIAERLRQAVAAEPINGLEVTMSFGVAGSEGPRFEADALLTAADIALYDAKAGGRDRVVGALTGPDDRSPELART